MSVKSENVWDYEEKAEQIHNGLQTFHAIVIVVVFKKIMGKEVTKKHFVFKTPKLLILQFKFWKVQAGQVPYQLTPFPVSVPRIIKTGGRAIVMENSKLLSENVLWKLREIYRTSSLMEFLLSKLQAYKAQGSALSVFKIQEIHNITSTVTFFFVEGNRFTEQQL